MPEHTTIATEYASAVAHPVRLRLVAALADGPRTLASLTSELDAPEAVVSSHAAALEELDALRGDTHDDGTLTYELRREPIVWDTAWGRLPVPVRRSVAGATVTQMAAMATAAVDRGGFDREDMHLTRTTITVDEARWRELSTLLGGTLHTLGDLEDAPAPDGSTGPTFLATAGMMLFTGEQPEIDAPAPSGRSSDEALKRIWELSEELDSVGTRSTTDWSSIHSIAEELRLLARSMKDIREAPAELGSR